MADFFNPISTTAVELQEALTNFSLTSVQIVETYLKHIEKHNKKGAKLNSIISTASENVLFKQAEILDEERRNGKLRGPYHGIPLIVKDVFTFGEEMGLQTTVGSFVFAGEKGKKNARVVQRVVDQGMLVLGTANLTEFCGHKSESMTTGWSAYAGQTRSAYDRENLDSTELEPFSGDKGPIMTACGGSSSGSAVSVSAGFAPLSLGSETTGSLVYPASKAGLYALRPTLKTVSAHGAFRISKSFDGIGGMARNPRDLTFLIDGILKDEFRRGKIFHDALTGSWEGIRVAVVDALWGGGDADKWSTEPVKSRYASLAEIIRKGGGTALYPATPAPPNTIQTRGFTLMQVAYHEFNNTVSKFCQHFENPKATNLAEIISWNETNKDIAMPYPHPDQKEIIASLNNKLTDEESDSIYVELNRIAGKDGMEKYMDEMEIDIVVSNSDCSLVAFTSCTGWPSATVPLGQLANGLPYGLFLLAKANQEEKIFRFMSAFEKSMPGVEAPVLNDA